MLQQHNEHCLFYEWEGSAVISIYLIRQSAIESRSLHRVI